MATRAARARAENKKRPRSYVGEARKLAPCGAPIWQLAPVTRKVKHLAWLLGGAATNGSAQRSLSDAAVAEPKAAEKILTIRR